MERQIESNYISNVSGMAHAVIRTNKKFYTQRDYDFFATTVPLPTEASIIVKQVEKTHWFPTIETMDRFFLSQLGAYGAREGTPGASLLQPVMPFRLNVATTNVARISRRGAANIIICNGLTRDYFIKLRLQGGLRTNSSIFVDSSIPNNTIIALYKGQNPYDSAAIYWEEDGGYALFVDDAVESWAFVFPITP